MDAYRKHGCQMKEKHSCAGVFGNGDDGIYPSMEVYSEFISRFKMQKSHSCPKAGVSNTGPPGLELDTCALKSVRGKKGTCPAICPDGVFCTCSDASNATCPPDLSAQILVHVTEKEICGDSFDV